MTNRKAIEILTDTIKDYETAVQNEREHPLYGRISSQKYINDLEKGIEALRFALRALEREGWIPVAERLPEEGQPVLVSRIRGREKRVEQGEKAEGDWWRIYGTRTKKVEAWMPLPEPYEEDIQ